MGISLACPFSILGDVESDFESILVKSISFGNGTKTPVRSVSFNDRDSEPMTMKSLGSGKMTKETSLSLRESDLEKMTLAKCFSPENKRMDLDDLVGTIQKSPVLDPTNPKHRAALQLQKVYKSFRTRRKLADCAVLAEQGWWKLLDFAELKRSSISFFDIEKHETAISRWSRARTRAAKVGKGLSKNDKAQKLALQHWLEAIDPRHRYGHNLHFYYIKWLHCESIEPFFYWLDVGEGKEVNLVEKCSRFKLQQQCIKYLGPMERLDYEVVVEDGKFVYKKSKEFLHTPEEAKDCKWIFVLSTSKTLYVGKKRKGTFQHSSFLAGGATSAAGRLVVKNGILKAVWPHSGHYRPTEENFKDFISFLEEQIVDLSDVKMSSIDDGDELLYKQKSSSPQRRSSSEDLIGKSSGSEGIHTEEIRPKISDTTGKEKEATMQPSNSKRLHILTRGLSNLEIPSRVEQIERLERGNQEVEVIPEESILKRINSHKGMMSFQLGRQLSCKWTTGAGPRIGCVRDYPPELQLRALQQVSLSPRSVGLPPRSVGLPRALFSSKRRHEHHNH